MSFKSYSKCLQYLSLSIALFGVAIESKRETTNLVKSDQDCTEEGYFADLTSCQKFRRCVKNEADGSLTEIIMDCSEGTNWCQSIGACSFDYQCDEPCQNPAAADSTICVPDDFAIKLDEAYDTTHDNNLYTLIVNPILNWSSAVDACAQRCGILTNVQTVETLKVLMQLADQPGLNGVWVGGQKSNKTQIFNWVGDDSQVDKTFWALNEPNDAVNNPCTVLTTQGGTAYGCQYRLPFICKNLKRMQRI